MNVKQVILFHLTVTVKTSEMEQPINPLIKRPVLCGSYAFDAPAYCY